MPSLSEYVAEELARFRRARVLNNTADAWTALERAHILSQPDAWQHTRVHWQMLMYAFETRDRREIAGQFARILVAGLGSALKKAPAGNTGRSNVGIMEVMPVPPELAAKLENAKR